MTIGEQIKWIESSVRRMRRDFPAQVARGALTQERATNLLVVGQATLETLTQLRGLVMRNEGRQTTGEAA